MENTRRTYLQAAAAGVASSVLVGCGSPFSVNQGIKSPGAHPPLALAAWGSFHVDGRDYVVSGKPVRDAAEFSM